MKMNLSQFKWMRMLPACLLLMAGFQMSCKDSVDTGDIYTFTGQTITDFVEADSSLSLFSKILEKSKVSKNSKSSAKALLSARGNYTVFAPDDDAVKTFLDSIYGSTEWDIDTMSEDVANKITHNCIIDHGIMNALLTSSLVKGSTSETTLNDRHIQVDFDTLEGGKFTIVLNVKSHITRPDIELTNGYLDVVDKVLDPSTATLDALINEVPNLRIFSLLLQKTSWADSLRPIRDEVYENIPAQEKKNEKYFNFTCPPHRYYGFMAFVETDSVFVADWNIPEPQFSAGRLLNEGEILEAIKTKCAEAYPNATDPDMTSSKNAINQFVSYHLVPFKEPYNLLVRHGSEIGFNTDLPDQLPMDIWTYFHAMGKPNRLFKITHTVDNQYHINRMSYHDNSFYGTMKETSVVDPGLLINAFNAPYENSCINGHYFPIDGIMLYTDFTRDAVLNERIRYNIAQYLPEMMSNDMRTGYKKSAYHYYIPYKPYPYCENLLNEGCDTDYRTPAIAGNTGWCGIESDQFAFSNNFDVTFKLMPVPFAGTWEIRYLVSNIAERGLAQGYFGTNPKNLVATGLPFDFRIEGGNPRIGSNVVADNVAGTDGDSLLAIENDLQMRNHMYMKGCKTWCRNYFGVAHPESKALRYRANSLRLIVYRGYMEPDKTYYFRFKTLLTEPSAYLFGDAFELCPKTVYDNALRNEDIW